MGESLLLATWPLDAYRFHFGAARGIPPSQYYDYAELYVLKGIDSRNFSRNFLTNFSTNIFKDNMADKPEDNSTSPPPTRPPPTGLPTGQPPAGPPPTGPPPAPGHSRSRDQTDGTEASGSQPPVEMARNKYVQPVLQNLTVLSRVCSIYLHLSSEYSLCKTTTLAVPSTANAYYGIETNGHSPIGTGAISRAIMALGLRCPVKNSKP